MMKTQTINHTRPARSSLTPHAILDAAADIALKGLTLLVVSGAVVFLLTSAIFSSMG